jgi:hypothetical protein
MAARTPATTLAVTTPTLVPDFVGDEVCTGAEPTTVDVECAVCTTVDPDCVTVKVGGRPVARGPAVAGPDAGVDAVAPPAEEPPIIDWTAAGT